MEDESDRTASLMTPAKLAQLKVRPKPAASPAAWLDQLAADAGSGHARRLVDLRRQLEAQVRERSYTGLQSTLKGAADALGKLDFSVLQPKGWLARATGRGKEEAAGFATQYERIVRAGEGLRDDLRGLQKAQQGQAGGTDRTLLEFDVEVKAIEKIIDQGARWLQDMRNQLKTREAQGGDEAARRQIAEDAARCELLVARLKVLRSASSAAQQATEKCRNAAARRGSLLAGLQRAADSEWKAWVRAVSPLAEEARASGAVRDDTDDARSAGSDLQANLRQLAADCTTLQAQEQGLADELAALHAPLQAAA